MLQDLPIAFRPKSEFSRTLTGCFWAFPEYFREFKKLLFLKFQQCLSNHIINRNIDLPLPIGRQVPSEPVAQLECRAVMVQTMTEL